MQLSDTATCTVQVATYLKFIGTTSQGPERVCTYTLNGVPHQGAGYYRQITWQVLDQNGQPILMAGLVPQDSFTNAGGTNSCGLPLIGGTTGKGSTDANGEFPDTYSICSGACVNGGNCQSTEKQSWQVSSSLLVGDVKTIVYMCTGITINGQ